VCRHSEPSEPSITLLRQYLARIDDDRLKRAFAAAIDVSQPKASTASTLPAAQRIVERRSLPERTTILMQG
jgi:hypothetical protein